MNQCAKQRGSILLIAIALIVGVSLLAVAFTSLYIGDTASSADHATSSQALFVAESGLSNALENFRTGTACAALNLNNMAFGNGTFTADRFHFSSRRATTITAAITAAATAIAVNYDRRLCAARAHYHSGRTDRLRCHCRQHLHRGAPWCERHDCRRPRDQSSRYPGPVRWCVPPARSARAGVCWRPGPCRVRRRLHQHCSIRRRRGLSAMPQPERILAGTLSPPCQQEPTC